MAAVLGSKRSNAVKSAVNLDASSRPSNKISRGKRGIINVNHLPPRAKSTNSKPSQSQTLKARSSPQNVFASKRKVSSTTQAFSRNAACNNLDDIVRWIVAGKARNIVVMVGAGISTASGIPDFRSPGTGLYDNLQQYRIPQPQSIFDRNYFEGNPRPFFTLAKDLYPGHYMPNYIHFFLRLLHEKGLLLRIYTQNIDGLERLAGIPPVKIVEAHGSFLTASCIRCHQSHPPDEIKNQIMTDVIPRCRKNGCLGLVKPNIVFFGEDLPKRFYYYLKDFPQADLLIVMGTSLEVEPFADIVAAVRHHIPRVLFNRVAVGPFRIKRRMNDVVATGDLVSMVQFFAEMLGWASELDDLIQKHGNEERKQQTSPVTNGVKVQSNLESQLSDLSLGSKSSLNGHKNCDFKGLQRPRYNKDAICLTEAENRSHLFSLARRQVRLLSDAKPPVFPSHRNIPTAPKVAKYGAKPISFHAQKHLYRRENDAESSSDEDLLQYCESSSSSDDDDDDDSEDD